MLPFEHDFMTIYEQEDRVIPDSNNFYTELFNVKPELITTAFLKQGWQIKKVSFTDYAIANNWSELVLLKNNEGLLLNGSIAYHPDNVNTIKTIFDSFNCSYNIEFYENQKLIAQFKK